MASFTSVHHHVWCTQAAWTKRKKQVKTMASFDSSATTGGAGKHVWTKNRFWEKRYVSFFYTIFKHGFLYGPDGLPAPTVVLTFGIDSCMIITVDFWSRRACVRSWPLFSPTFFSFFFFFFFFLRLLLFTQTKKVDFHAFFLHGQRLVAGPGPTPSP